MARKQKDTFFQDMAGAGLRKALISLSQAGELPQVTPDNFPQFQVYACRDESLGDLTCDLACKLGNTRQEKQEVAATLIGMLGDSWAVNPFSGICQSGPGFIHFRIPAGATKR